MVAFSFLTGCVSVFHFTSGLWLAGLLVLAITVVLLRRRLGMACHFAIALCVFCTGLLYTETVLETPQPDEGTYEITATVSGGTNPRSDNRISFVLADIGLDDRPISGKAYCSLHYEEQPPELFDGARVRFTGRVYHPEGKSGEPRMDFRLWMRQNGLAFGISCYQEIVIENTPETASMCDPFYRISKWFETLYAKRMGESSRIAMALLFGQRNGLTDDEYAAFQELGIAHIMSVSGLHVALLGRFVMRLLHRIRVRKRTAVFSVCLFLALYCGVTGFSAAALRASVMLVLVMVAHAHQRKPDRLTLLAAAMLIVLICKPLDAFSAGFVLSFSAMLGIVLYARTIELLLHRLWPPVNLRGRNRTRSRVLLAQAQQSAKGTLCIILTAQLGTLLPTAYYFHQLPLFGIAVNLFIVPFVSGVLIPVYLAVLPFPVLGGLAACLTDGLLKLVELLSTLPYVAIRVASPPVILCFALGLALVILSRRVPGVFRRRLLAAVFVALAGLGSAYVQRPTEVRYIQLAVGQADSALVMDGSTTLLIDTGVDGSAALDYLLYENRDIDALFLTHLHVDHAGGVETLLDRGIAIHQVYLPAGAQKQYLDPAMAELVPKLEALGVPVAELARGHELRYNKVAITALWPERETLRMNQNANQYPLVLAMNLDGYTLLQASDLSGAYEAYAAVPADVLKVAHHGSSRSTGEAFLRFVNPEYALISASSGSKSLPGADTLSRLTEHGITLLRTDECGDITLSVKDGELLITPYKRRQSP